jgi:hypothetical protein
MKRWRICARCSVPRIRQHYISEIENGLQNLTLGTMVTLAGAVGSDIRTLLRRPPKPR